ncbi:MAG: hypothetical protein ACFHU9_05910 [Fluviicola sp.]
MTNRINKITSIILLACTLPWTCYSFILEQEKQNDLIKWTESSKLEWNDFQGAPPKTTEHKAMTFTTINAMLESYSEDSIVYRIDNFFNKEKSWTLDNHSKSLLAHEQLHFDISELITRRTRKAYSLIDLSKLNGDYSEISNTFEHFTTHVKDSLNEKYDRETKHGVDLEQQEKWQLYVQSELDKLAEHTSPIVIIK